MQRWMGEGWILARPMSVCVLERHSSFLDLQFHSLQIVFGIREEQVNF